MSAPTYEDREIPFDEIHADKKQPRKAFARIEQLANSIEEAGLLQPIVVADRPDGGYRIVAGGRRYAAITRLREADPEKFRRVPVRIRSGATRSGNMLGQLAENSQRENLKPWEYGAHFAELRALGYTDPEIARSVGRSRTWVTNCRKICDLTDDGITPAVNPDAIKLLAKSRTEQVSGIAMGLVKMLDSEGRPDHDRQLAAVEAHMLRPEDRTVPPQKRTRRKRTPVGMRREQIRELLHTRWNGRYWPRKELMIVVDYVTGARKDLGELA